MDQKSTPRQNAELVKGLGSRTDQKEVDMKFVRPAVV